MLRRGWIGSSKRKEGMKVSSVGQPKSALCPKAAGLDALVGVVVGSGSSPSSGTVVEVLSGVLVERIMGLRRVLLELLFPESMGKKDRHTRTCGRVKKGLPYERVCGPGH